MAFKTRKNVFSIGFLESRLYLYPLLLFASAGLLFFLALGARDFWAPGEPIYGEIIRVMFDRNEWVIPTLNGELFSDKPVLYFWLALIFSKVAGRVSEWTVRLPAALGGMGMVLTTYSLGKTFYDRRTGFMSALILATAYRVVWESRFLRFDTVLSYFLVFGFYLFLRAFLRKQSSGLYLCAYICFALAALTKGPIGLVLPGLTVLCLLFFTGRWDELRKMHLVPGFLLVAVVLFPWLFLLHLRGEDQWVRDFLLIHNVQNYALEPIGHVRPFYYYLENLPLDFLPWTFLIPGALIYYYPWRERLREPATLALFCWFAVIFVFFSFSKSKLAYYLLPLLPSLAILAGCYLNSLFSKNERRGFHWRWTLSSLYVLSGVLWAGGAVLPALTRKLEPDLFLWSAPLSLILVGGSIGMILRLGRKRIATFFSTFVIVLLGLLFIGSVGVMPYLDKFKSPRLMGEFIMRHVPIEAPVYIFRSTMTDFNYYARRGAIPVINSRNEVEKLFSQNQGAHLLINEKDLKQLNLEQKPNIVTEKQVGERKWYLIKLSVEGR